MSASDGKAPRHETSEPRRQWALMLFGLVPLAAGIVVWLRVIPVSVSSADELGRVGFGWPLAWTFQDQTRFHPVAFPMRAEFIGGKGTVDPPPTQNDWWMFAANTAIFWAVLAAVLVLALQVVAAWRTNPQDSETPSRR